MTQTSPELSDRTDERAAALRALLAQRKRELDAMADPQSWCASTTALRATPPTGDMQRIAGKAVEQAIAALTALHIGPGSFVLVTDADPVAQWVRTMATILLGADAAFTSTAWPTTYAVRQREQLARRAGVHLTQADAFTYVARAAGAQASEGGLWLKADEWWHVPRRRLFAQSFDAWRRMHAHANIVVLPHDLHAACAWLLAMTSVARGVGNVEFVQERDPSEPLVEAHVHPLCGFIDLGGKRKTRDLHVVDAAGRILPAGAVGELAVRLAADVRPRTGDDRGSPETPAQWIRLRQYGRLGADGTVSLLPERSRVLVRGF